MRTRWIIAVAAAQVALLLFMAGEREWVLHTGRTVILRTVPLDPDDPMRGAYVRLTHELNRVPKAQCHDGLVSWFAPHESTWRFQRSLRDQRVYATLRLNETNVAELVFLSNQKPASGLFLRGRVESVDDDSVQVRYGVEALFMAKQNAQKLDTERFGSKAGVPLDLDVRVDPRGLAVTRAHHWESLGLTVAIDRPAPTTTPQNQLARPPRAPTGATLTLKNHGTTPIAIVNRPGGRSFRLISETRWGFANDLWAHETEPLPEPTPADVIILQPGENQKVSIDFSAAAWTVLHRINEENPVKPVLLAQLDPSGNTTLFRFEYVPPSPIERAKLPHADLISTTPLKSRAFNLWSGGVD